MENVSPWFAAATLESEASISKTYCDICQDITWQVNHTDAEPCRTAPIYLADRNSCVQTGGWLRRPQGTSSNCLLSYRDFLGAGGDCTFRKVMMIIAQVITGIFIQQTMRVANEDDELLVLQKKRLVESHAKGVPWLHYVLGAIVRFCKAKALQHELRSEPCSKNWTQMEVVR